MEQALLTHPHTRQRQHSKQASAQVQRRRRKLRLVPATSTHLLIPTQRPPAVHISDLISLYALLTTKILQKSPIPSGEKGHYFAFNHRAPAWALMDRIATALYSRGLVSTSDVKTWPSYKVAAKDLHLPETYIQAMCCSTGDLEPVNAYELGWQPEWSEERYLASIDDEVQAALDLDTGKASRYDLLLAAEE